MKQFLDEYYGDNAKKLHKVVDRILQKFGGMSGKDNDDFYSLANEVFVDVLRRYDGVQSFDGFLYSCLQNKIKSEITRRNREKRRADRMCVSLDMPVGEDGGGIVGELLMDGFDMERELFGGLDAVTLKLERYLIRLSGQQREVMEMLSYCYRAAEIQEALHMTQREYADAVESIRSYENIKILL